jgi:hypothetical protein
MGLQHVLTMTMQPFSVKYKTTSITSIESGKHLLRCPVFVISAPERMSGVAVYSLRHTNTHQPSVCDGVFFGLPVRAEDAFG